MIDKEIQDQLWQCAPKAFREKVKRHFFKKNAQSSFSIECDVLCKYFGHHNLTSDAEPEEMLMVPRKTICEMYAANERIMTDFRGKINGINSDLINHVLRQLFGSKCLPDDTKDGLKDDSKVAPKKFFESEYNVGDKVIVCITSIGKPRKEVVTLIRQYQPECEHNDFEKQWVIKTPDGMEFQSKESHFEPYTGPTQPENENQSNSTPLTNDNMEEKELNLCEILDGKDGKGLKIYSCISGEDELSEVIPEESNPGVLPFIRVGEFVYHPNGTLFDGEGGTCLLYPSRESYLKYPLDAKKAWQEFVEANKPKRWRAENRHLYWYICDDGNIGSVPECLDENDNNTYEFGNYFRTQELAQQAAEAVRKCLESFHENHKP